MFIALIKHTSFHLRFSSYKFHNFILIRFSLNSFVFHHFFNEKIIYFIKINSQPVYANLIIECEIFETSHFSSISYDGSRFSACKRKIEISPTFHLNLSFFHQVKMKMKSDGREMNFVLWEKLCMRLVEQTHARMILRVPLIYHTTWNNCKEREIGWWREDFLPRIIFGKFSCVRQWKIYLIFFFVFCHFFSTLRHVFTVSFIIVHDSVDCGWWECR